jgi:hypothetical protein
MGWASYVANVAESVAYKVSTPEGLAFNERGSGAAVLRMCCVIATVTTLICGNSRGRRLCAGYGAAPRERADATLSHHVTGDETIDMWRQASPCIALTPMRPGTITSISPTARSR